MASDPAASHRPVILLPLALGGRAAAFALRPVSGAARAALGVSVRAERRAVDRVLDSGEPERLVTTALNDVRVQEIIRQALHSEGAAGLVDAFFTSGLFDHLAQRLTESDALWRLVDEIAQSPAVMAAVSQQGLGFVDQVGRAARERSRQADHRIEGTVGRLRSRRRASAAAEPDPPRP
jgi:hypothetical protein